MKRKISFALIIILSMMLVMQTVVVATNASLYNNNTLSTATYFTISSTGRAAVVVDYEGYPDVTTGATITIKIEKRTLLLFWSDVVEDTITVVGERYFDELYYQLEATGTYRCTVIYTISGTGGADDVIPFEDTAKYE